LFDTFDGFGFFHVGDAQINFEFLLDENIFYFQYDEDEDFKVSGLAEVDLVRQHMFYVYRFEAKNDIDTTLQWQGNLGWDGCGFGSFGTADGVSLDPFDPEDFTEVNWFTSAPEEPYNGDKPCDIDDLIGFTVYNPEGITLLGRDGKSFVFTPFGDINDDLIFSRDISMKAGEVVGLAFGITLEFMNRNISAITDLTEAAGTFYYDTRIGELFDIATSQFDLGCPNNTF